MLTIRCLQKLNEVGHTPACVFKHGERRERKERERVERSHVSQKPPPVLLRVQFGDADRKRFVGLAKTITTQINARCGAFTRLGVLRSILLVLRFLPKPRHTRGRSWPLGPGTGSAQDWGLLPAGPFERGTPEQPWRLCGRGERAQERRVPRRERQLCSKGVLIIIFTNHIYLRMTKAGPGLSPGFLHLGQLPAELHQSPRMVFMPSFHRLISSSCSPAG